MGVGRLFIDDVIIVVGNVLIFVEWVVGVNFWGYGYWFYYYFCNVYVYKLWMILSWDFSCMCIYMCFWFVGLLKCFIIIIDKIVLIFKIIIFLYLFLLVYFCRCKG